MALKEDTLILDEIKVNAYPDGSVYIHSVEDMLSELLEKDVDRLIHFLLEMREKYKEEEV